MTGTRSPRGAAHDRCPCLVVDALPSRSCAGALLALLALLVACGDPPPLEPARRTPRLAIFVETFRKADGGFGPPGQARSNPRWTFMALATLASAGLLEPQAEAARVKSSLVAAEDMSDSFDAAGMELARLRAREVVGLPVAQEAQAVLPPLAVRLPTLVMDWMGPRPLSSLEEEVELRVRRGAPGDAVSVVVPFLALWRGADGGWRYPATLAEVFPLVRDGLVLGKAPKPGKQPSSAGITASAVAILQILKRAPPGPERATSFLRTLRSATGGYLRQAGAPGEGDLWTTWNVLRTLDALGTLPDDQASLAGWILSRRRRNGGFAHALGEPATLEATWLAHACLDLLGRDAGPVPESAPGDEDPDVEDPGGLKLFQAAFEIGPEPEVVSVLARRAGIDLVLMKGDRENQLARRVQAFARAQGISVRAGCAREEHRRAFGRPGLGYATHCSDLVFAADQKLALRDTYDSFEKLLQAWGPDRSAGARVVSCSFRHRELLEPVYARSLRGAAGYDGLMATWAMVPDGDLLRHHPWLQRFVTRLAPIGNHDAHGDPFHWFGRGLRTRTLFFARSGDLKGFRDALAHGRTVAVAHGAGEPVLYGHRHWTTRAQGLREQWDRGRPPSARGPWLPDPVVIPVDDTTAAALPYVLSGHAILVRAAAIIGDDAFPDEVALKLDGMPVLLRMQPAERGRSPGLWAPLPGLAPGEHRIEVSAFGRSVTETWSFGKPVNALSERDPVPLPPLRTALELDDPDELPFLQLALAPDELRGFVSVTARRADFLLRQPPGRCSLVIDHEGGARAGHVEVFVDGSSVGTLEASPGKRSVARLSVPAGAGPRRVSLRTALAGWMPSMPVPRGDLRIHGVSFRLPGEGR